MVSFHDITEFDWDPLEQLIPPNAKQVDGATPEAHSTAAPPHCYIEEDAPARLGLNIYPDGHRELVFLDVKRQAR